MDTVSENHRAPTTFAELAQLATLSGALALLVGCSNDAGTPPSAAPTSQVEASPAPEQAANSVDDAQWSIHETGSAFDGKTLAAVKTYKSPETDSSFAVQITCTPANRAWSIKVSSFVGDGTKNPDSAFRLNYDLPEGRVKFGSQQPAQLFALFDKGDYENELAFSGGSSDIREMAREYLRKEYRAANGIAVEDGYQSRSVKDKQLHEVTGWNFAAVFQKLLPLALEVENGNGKSEFVIDPSEAITKALAPCGGNDAPYDPKPEAARVQADNEAENAFRKQQQARVQAEQDSASAPSPAK